MYQSGGHPRMSDQVREMMKIYANADRVIVWLGEEADDSYMAIRAIKMLNHEESRESFFNCQHEHVCLSQLTRLYNALICLYERPWFSRMWIWQEVMVARDLVVCCGTSQASWKPLKRAARCLWQLRAMIQPSPDHELHSISTLRLELIKMLKQGWIFGLSIMGCSPERDRMYELHAGGPLGLIFISHLLQASDQRDKVCAFLGLGRVKTTSAISTNVQPGGPTPSESTELGSKTAGQ
jgi:hypothetical protein